MLEPAAVREQLEKILAHALFRRSARMGRFLRLAVERVLQGRTSELKESLLGVEVFDRDASYNPRVDPIVRVEARRLRSKLRAYYEGDGRQDPIVFEFATGSYIPRILLGSDRAETTVRPSGQASIPTVAVLPLANLSGNSDHDYFREGLTEELLHALAKESDLRVVAWNPRDALWNHLQVADVVTGSVRVSGDSVRVRAQLIEKETGIYLWSETFDRRLQDLIEIQEEIARTIAGALHVRLRVGLREHVGPGREAVTAPAETGRTYRTAAARRKSSSSRGTATLSYPVPRARPGLFAP